MRRASRQAGRPCGGASGRKTVASGAPHGTAIGSIVLRSHGALARWRSAVKIAGICLLLLGCRSWQPSLSCSPGPVGGGVSGPEGYAACASLLERITHTFDRRRQHANLVPLSVFSRPDLYNGGALNIRIPSAPRSLLVSPHLTATYYTRPCRLVAKMVLTLFNLENSRSFRVHWLINELQAPVEVRHYARVEGKKAVPEMARDSGFKLGKSPVLVEDGTGTGGGSGKYTVSESGNCLMCVDAACGWAAEAVDC